MKKGDICLVKVVLPGKWPLWYFATIIDLEYEEQDNWSVYKAQVIGENFVRDTFEGIYRIADPVKQEAARQLAKKQWGAKGYATLDLVRAAILEIAP